MNIKELLQNKMVLYSVIGGVVLIVLIIIILAVAGSGNNKNIEEFDTK